MTPKYFASSTLCSTCPHREYIKERGLPGIAMCIILHFPGLNRMPQSLPHPSRADRSCCNARLSDWDLICLYNKQSSTNSRTWDETTLSKSFICNRKSRGPSTVPCGTPDSTLLAEDLCPSTTTCWSRVLKKAAVHCSICPWMP